MQRLRSAAVTAITGVLYAVLGSTVAAASFTATSSAAITASTKRIFPTAQLTSAWDLRDASAGSTPVSGLDPWAAVDARLFTTSNLASAFNAARYIELTMSSPLAPSIPVSAVTLNLTMAANGGGTACLYAEIRRASTNVLLGTHGSASSPLVCSSSTTQATTTVALGTITSSTDADDLKVKLFLRSSTSRRIAFDRVTVTGSAYSSSFTLFESSVTNSSSGTASTTPWALAEADATTFAPASAWTTEFSSARFLSVAFPAVVPAGATITAVTLRHAYASTAASTTSCVYFEVYSGSTLLGSFGSPSSPYSCNGTTTQATDTIEISQADTASELNGLVVRVYVRNGGSGATRHGLFTLTTAYSLV